MSKGTKKILSVIVILVILIALYFLLETRTDFTNEDDVPFEAAVAEGLADNDSDADGIPDWQEILLGLDPYSIDTDGDGIQDGVAINTSLGIIEQAPNDDTPPLDQTVIIDEDLSRTDRIGRQLFTIVQLLEASGDLSEEEKADIKEKFASDLLAVPEYATYDLLLLELTEGSTPVDELLYIDEVMQVINNYNYDSPNPASVLLEATQEDNQELLELLVLPLENHQKTLDELLAMKVFPTHVISHLELINLVERVRHDTEGMRNFFLDPANGFNSLMIYGSNLETLAEVINEMADKFLKAVEAYEEEVANR